MVNMMKWTMKSYAGAFLLLLLVLAAGQDVYGEPAAVSKKSSKLTVWRATLQKSLPTKLTVPVAKKRKALLFSVTPGYKHKCIPYTSEMLKLLAEHTGACEIHASNDIGELGAERIKQYDAIIFNNTCSHGRERHLFRDILLHQVKKYGKKYVKLSVEKRQAMAAAIEKSVLDHIASGKGLMVIHGAITVMNGSEEFTRMIGAGFDYHPPLQELSLIPAEKDHPLLKAFGGKPLVHLDEPYLMKGSDWVNNVRPLLRYNPAKIKGMKQPRPMEQCCAAWIKAYKKGRVFYLGPSHRHQSYQQARLLQFTLDGLQYVLGDLKCDDSPVKPYMNNSTKASP